MADSKQTVNEIPDCVRLYSYLFVILGLFVLTGAGIIYSAFVW